MDVFFVISGYLITNLILNEINQTGSFDFKRFYIRRMRRLFPAMVVTFSASFFAAALLFPPERLQPFGQSFVAAIFSVSNVQFWTESGYFDAGSHLKPLLHTWSLGVEEQFYLIWPVLLWLFARRDNRNSALCVVAAVGLTSFGLNYLWVSGGFDEDFASTIFFLTPFRMFELAIGALAVFLTPIVPGKRFLHESFMLVGLGLIAFSIFTYTEESPLPYLHALPPCFGALLVILARESRSAGSLLTNPLSVWIGLISYSIYLVHWPLLVFYKYYTLDDVSGVEAIGLTSVTVLLAAALYYFVEKRYRHYAPNAASDATQHKFVRGIVTTMLLIAGVGYLLTKPDIGILGGNHVLSVAQISEGKKRRNDLYRQGCNLSRLEYPKYCAMDKTHQILVFGNSHELDGFNIFSTTYEQSPSVNLIGFGNLNHCKPRMTDKGPISHVTYRNCDKRVALLSDEGFTRRLSGIVVSFNRPFATNKEKAWGILRHLKARHDNLSIVVLGGFINTDHPCSELINRFGTYSACSRPEYASYDPFDERARAIAANPVTDLDYLYIDKTRLLCTTENSLASCRMRAGDEPAFYDQHHLSLSYAKMLGQRVAEGYGEDLVRVGFPVPTGLRELQNTTTK